MTTKKLQRVIESAELRRRVRRLRDHPRWGNLRRLDPFSRKFGFDRGTPIDRFLIERFLAQQSALIRGHVLDVGDDIYVRRFGRDAVDEIDIVDIDQQNPHATIVGDLACERTLPAGRFDLVLLAQTLQYVQDVPAALANCWQSLRPGGAMLICVPSLSRVDPNMPPETDLWRFTPAGLGELVRTAAPDASLAVHGLGNLIAAVAFLQGLAAEELRRRELSLDDERFPLVAAACLVKPVA